MDKFTILEPVRLYISKARACGGITEKTELLACLLPFLLMKSQKGIHDRYGGRCVTLHRTS